jgi:hypothetical protein
MTSKTADGETLTRGYFYCGMTQESKAALTFPQEQGKLPNPLIGGFLRA